MKISDNPVVYGLFAALIIRFVCIENLNSFNRLILPVISALSALSAVVFISAVKSRGRGEFSGLLYFFAAAAAGFIISLGFNSPEISWSGLPLEKVAGIKGAAVCDSRRVSSGRFMTELRISETRGRNGAVADAGGRVLLFSDSDPRIFRGELLSADTGLYTSAEYAQVMDKQTAGEVSLLRNQAVFFGRISEGVILRDGWLSGAHYLRASLMRIINRRCAGLAGGAGGLFTALFTGNRDGLSAEEARVFREAGCSHILALSGMHLGIISGLILLVLKPLPGRKPAFIISCLIIFGYLYLTGFGVSLVRAALMYFIGGTALVFCRRVKGIHVLLLSFIILVIIKPADFYTLSFQLSFLAVAGILLISPYIDRLFRPVMPRFISMALSCSIAAQFFVIPILIKYFGELYPAGIAAGIIIAPMVTVFIWIGIIYLITGAGVVSSAAGFLYRALFFISGRAADLPSIKTAGAEIPVIVFYGILAAALLFYSIYRSRVDGISGQL